MPEVCVFMITKCICTHTHFLLMTFCQPHSLSPEKSTQSGERTAGDSKASARQQRPTVFLVFGSQTKHVCTHRAQVTKTPHTEHLYMCVRVCVCRIQTFLSSPPSLSSCCLTSPQSLSTQRQDRHASID